MSIPKLFPFLPVRPAGSVNDPFLSNPIPCFEYSYRLTSTCFVDLTAPNKLFSNVGKLLIFTIFSIS